jgi:hypothetical protein
MKIRILVTIIGLLMFNLTFGQDREKYSELIKEAWNLYESKEYLNSGKKYAEAFVALNNRGMVTDRYNAACSWSLAKQTDSSFIQLFKITKNGNYTNLGHITTDTDLNALHSDKRWKEVILIVTENKEKAEKDLDKPLVAILDSIYKEDQSYRRQIGEIEEKYGRDSKEMKAHWEIINEKDSINLIKIVKILDERGWLGADIIGRQGNSTLFLVIQHSNLETQIKYLPMMREAVKKRNSNASSLALLEDRVALKQGNRQIYGSQIGRDKETGEYFVSPLIDPENVDKRRAEVGLGTLADYVGHWDMTWNIEKHKEQTKKVEAEKEK